MCTAFFWRNARHIVYENPTTIPENVTMLLPAPRLTESLQQL